MSDFGLERDYIQPIHRETYFQHYNEKEQRERREEKRKKRYKYLYYHDQYGNLYFKTHKQKEEPKKPNYEIGVYYYTQDSSYMYYYDESGYVHYYEIIPQRHVYNAHPHEPNYTYKYYGTWRADELEQYYQQDNNGYYR